jgi:translocation and assembly module TamB
MAWKTRFLYLGIILLASVAALGVAASLILRSQRFHQYVIAEIQKQAGDATGARVHIQDFALHLSKLATDVYGITIRGSEPEGEPPLLQADQLTIGLKIVSLLRKKIDLREIVLQRPVINLEVSKDGATNLPAFPKSNNGKSTDPLDLGIKHVLIERGELFYSGLKTPLNADLHDLQLEIRAGLMAKGYQGNLSYQRAHIQYADMKPLLHDLTASFNVNPSELTLNPLILRVASSTLKLEGHVRNFARPSATGSYQGTIHLLDFASLIKSTGIRSGDLNLDGSISYQYQSNIPILHTVDLSGHLRGHELAIDTADLRTVIHDARASFEMANATLDVPGLETDLLGGHLSATARVQRVDTASTAKVHANWKEVSLGIIKAAVRRGAFEQAPVEGQVGGSAEATWTGGLKNIAVSSDLTLQGAIRRADQSTRVPFDGAIHARYDGPSETATLANSFVKTPQTRVELHGTAGQKFNLSLQAHAADLGELDSLAAAFQSDQTQPTSNWTLAGLADLQLLLDGAAGDPQLHGHLISHGLQIENTHWRDLDVGLRASRSGVSFEHGSLVNADQGFVNFDLSCGLSDWRYLASSPITVGVNSQDLAIDQFLQMAKINVPISGILSLDVAMKGSQLNPEGTGSLRLVHAKVYGEPVKQIAVRVQGNGNALNSALAVSAPAGSAKGTLTFYPKNKGYELQLDAGTVQLAALQAVQQRDLGISGELSANATGHGTLNDPQVTAKLQIPQLRIREASISGIKADLNVANHKSQIALDSEVAQSLVQAHGIFDLDGEHYFRAALDTKGIPIEALLALYAPQVNGAQGLLEMHATAEGPIADLSRMQAEIRVPTCNAQYQGLELHNVRQVRIRYADSIITLDPAEITGTDTTLHFQGQLPLRGGAPATLSANGVIDLQLLRFIEPDLQSSGKLQVDLRETQAAGHAAAQGQLRLEKAALTLPDAPVGVQNVNGILDIRNGQLNITQLVGEAGGGQISARGLIEYRPQLKMDVALQATKIRVRYQDAIRSVLDGDLSLIGTSQGANLKGRVLVDSLSFTQNFDLAAFAGQIESGPQAETGPHGMADKVKLDIAVQTSRDLNLSSSALSLKGLANLRLVGTAADPVVIGRTEFTAGDIFLMNKRYEIERGVIQFSNPNRTEPVLNVRLTTTINQYNLSLTFRGPLDKMQTSYVSVPPLPTADIINLIVRDKTAEQGAASPSNLAASSLLAQGAASEVSSGVQKLAGLSSFSVDPTLGGNDTDPGARVAMQKRVTNNFLFTFATDVTSTQRELIQGEYQFNKRWSASVTRDENGGFAIDGKFRKRF